MKPINPHEAVAAAMIAAENRRKEAEEQAAERAKVRMLARAKVLATMEMVIRPAIHEMREALSAQSVGVENGYGTDRFGNSNLTLRLRQEDFPRAAVFTAEDHGAEPRVTYHEELGHGVMEPKRRELGEPDKAEVMALLADFLHRAM